jgi:DNA-binding IclR family transcriptional regulator
MSQVPAAEKTLDVLLVLARAAGPIAAATISRETGIAKSSLYHLLNAMATKGFVVSTENAQWALGVSAFEVGTAYMRHEPMERSARPLLTDVIARIRSVGSVVGHVGILRGNDTLYLLKESSDHNITLVTDVGVRLPANLTASGRAMLAGLPDAQVRALFPNKGAFVDRTGHGPQTLSQLRQCLATERRAGYASEEGFISEGYSSVASAVFDHLGQPVAAIGMTYRTEKIDALQREILIEVVKDSASKLTVRIGGLRPKVT